jgi:hypothetical protein
MAGLLSDILGFVDRSKQTAKANLGLLFNDPKEYLATMEGQARDFNRLQSLAVQGDLNASKGLPVTPEQLSARQYVDRVTNDIAMGFAGTTSPKIRTQALLGGEIAESNGFFYKGGQFLPTTTAEPGKWKVGKKWVTSGKELIEPGVTANQPTPFSRSIFSMINQLLEKSPTGQFKWRENVRFGDGSQFSPEATIRPGVKGVLGKEELTFQEMLDAYNNGQRWFDVAPDVLTITTKVK